jgi:hypothetical protein
VSFSTYSVCRVNERIIDSYDVDVIVLNGISEDDTANTTEAVDANLYWCHDSESKSACCESIIRDPKALCFITL